MPPLLHAMHPMIYVLLVALLATLLKLRATEADASFHRNDAVMWYKRWLGVDERCHKLSASNYELQVAINNLRAELKRKHRRVPKL